ncbi:MAG: repeat-containing protein [Chthonomonadales bacterium]|nr:repeat-containing protein [Chthonomonadales bacterium]
MRDTPPISESAHSRAAVTRRQLLLRAGYTAAGLALAHGAEAEQQTPKIVLGEGDHKYECLHDWLVPPDNIQWGDTQGLAQDAKGNLYITHTVNKAGESKDAIVVFDKNGKFLTSWGSRFAGGGHGIDIRKEHGKEVIYHCDTAHRQVVKTTLTGDVLWEKGLPTEAGVYKEKNPFVPTNVAFAPNGDFYIADGYGSHWIHQYNLKGEWIRTFGGPGTEPGKFRTPHGICLDTRREEPLLVITDRANSRLQYFTLDGKYVSMVTEGMRKPCYFGIRDDHMIVADLQSTVTLLDKDNKVVVQLGDGAAIPDLRGHPRSDFIPGKFIHPHAAKYLHNGDILVAEYVPIGRITLLRKMRA